MSAVSAIAISLEYLRRRPLPHLGCNSYSRDSIGSYVVLSISEFKGFRSISESDSSDSNYKYGLTTINQKDIGPLNNLTIYVSPLTISRLYSPS